MTTKSIKLQSFIIDVLKEQIKDHRYYGLIKDILIDTKKHDTPVATAMFITIELCDNICFAPQFRESTRCYWTYSTSTNDNYQDIKGALQKIIYGIKDDLYKVDIRHKPLQYDLGCDEITPQEIKYLSDSLFKTNYSDLNPSQRSIIFGCLGRRIISSGSELVKYLEDFMCAHRRFPFKYENLYKAYEYAIEIQMLTEEHLIKIEEMRNDYRKEHSQACLHQLLTFCTEKKRWFYTTEKEMVDCINYVYHYYRYDWYSEQECKTIDDLFKIYANNESKGELAVNTCLVKLGYDIEKQFTFDDCKDKRKLPFDTMFYVDKTLCLIEFDGEQHFKPIEYFGGEEHLKYIQHHDKIKNEYCKTNNIPLLRIRYDEIDKIDEFINQFINSVKTRTAQ